MNSEWFKKVIKEQIKTCEDVLIGKAKEYATDDDRLHNFKNAAGMMSCDPKEALAGMMAKHTISVYDMCRSGKDYPIELWNEKITDHINYLLLLKAVVEEDYWHETLGDEGEKIVKELKRMAENSTYGLVTTKFEDNTPKIKADPSTLDEAINSFRRVLAHCTNAECILCPYSEDMTDGGSCDKRLLEDFDNIIIRLKDEKNAT